MSTSRHIRRQGWGATWLVATWISEVEVGDWDVDRRVDLLHRRHQFLVRQPREVAVDHSLEVRDKSLHLVGEAHVFETPRVQSLLLPWEIREVLLRYRWPAGIV